MPASAMNEVVQYFRRNLLPEEAVLTDGQLLERFASRREPAALEALVRRHGPMVWGVCRRILGNHHDAEDAFQATFLVLVRKGPSVQPRAKIGNWLYGVAHQTALKARATRAKQKLREAQVTDMPESTVAEPNSWDDLQAVLDQELSRLPEKYRTVVVLCDLEGKAGKEAARQLGLAQGTVASRLARARAMLAKRLARHGLTASGSTLAAVLCENAVSAPVPGSVLSFTIKAVTLAAAEETAVATLVSAKVAALAEGVTKAMLVTKLKNMIAVTLAAAAMFGLGAGVLGYRALAAPQNEGKGRPPGTVKADQLKVEQQKPSKDDMASLQGTWKLVSSESDGVTIGEGRPEIQGSFAVFKKSSVMMTWKMFHSPQVRKPPEDAKAVGTFTLDTKRNPRAIVITWQTNPAFGKEDMVQRGIYAVDGDTLKLCFYFAGKDVRSLVPTEFSAKAGSKRAVSIFKRVRSSDEGKDERIKAPPSDLGKIQPPGGAPLDKGKPKSEKVPVKKAEEKAKLQGTWQLISFEFDGLKLGEGRHELKDGRLLVEQESLTFCFPETWPPESATKKAVAHFAFGAGRTPGMLVLTWKECPWNREKHFVQKAIYAVDGDSLKICLSRKDQDKEAPTEFSAPVGSERLVWIFRRISPAAREGTTTGPQHEKPEAAP
jgi:RNA polymerase sigma factor (sigma-70 family)